MSNQRRCIRAMSRGERALWRAVTADVTRIKGNDGSGRGRPVPVQAPAVRAAETGAKQVVRGLSARCDLRAEAPPQLRGRSPEMQPPRAAAFRQYSGEAQRVCLDDVTRARKVARGGIRIEARLDLHGRTQDEALEVLADFLDNASARSFRCVLIITGKGLRSPAIDAGMNPEKAIWMPDRDMSHRGVLRRQLPFWVQNRFSSRVISMAPAHIRHGGIGAFYLFLRKMR